MRGWPDPENPKDQNVAVINTLNWLLGPPARGMAVVWHEFVIVPPRDLAPVLARWLGEHELELRGADTSSGFASRCRSSPLRHGPLRPERFRALVSTRLVVELDAMSRKPARDCDAPGTIRTSDPRQDARLQVRALRRTRALNLAAPLVDGQQVLVQRRMPSGHAASATATGARTGP